METQEHMERLIRRENVKHFRELLKTVVKEEAERRRIRKLLAQEQQKLSSLKTGSQRICTLTTSRVPWRPAGERGKTQEGVEQ